MVTPRAKESKLMTIYEDAYKASDLAKGKMNEVFTASYDSPQLINHKSFGQFELVKDFTLDGICWVLTNLCGGRLMLWHDDDHNSFGWVPPESFLIENKEKAAMAMTIKNDTGDINENLEKGLKELAGPIFGSRVEAIDEMICVLFDPERRLF